MKHTLLALSFLLIASLTHAAEVDGVAVAKVDFDEIDDLLTSVVLDQEGNEALRERFYQKKQASEEAQAKMQQAIMNGEPFDPMAAARSSMHNDDDRKRVEQLCQKFLLEMIERNFEGKYDLILKDEYRSSLIYSKIAIDDVTVVVKQELLKALPIKDR